MDETAEYLPMFLAEGREHLQELNLAVVRIEETPDDQATVDEIFRIAHSLKGMSATMGFAGMAALTHEMEDVFELLRQRKGGLERSAVDVLLECLDALEAAVDAIESSGAEAITPDPLIARLRTLVRDDEEAAPAASAEESTSAGVLFEPPADLSELAQGRRVVQVHATLVADASIPSVRAYMILSTLAGLGETLACRPGPEEVETFTGSDIVAWLVSDRTDAELAEAAASVAEVEDAQTSEAVADAAIDAGETLPEATAPAAAEPSKAAAPRSANHGSSTVRVDAERLDQLMHAMGELVLHRTHVEGLAAHADVPGLPQALQALTRTSHALQAMVMQVRMIPVEAVLLRFPRLVRDLSVKLSKQVELELIGKDTELDRSVVDSLGDPLVHLIRNSLDHGLETPEERRAAGKPETGRLEISARHAGGNVVISVSDDGRGIDPARVAKKAVERGLITPEAAEAIDMARATELLFHPGFSTADVTSDISGRGVGMDAVRVAIRGLGGEVTMTSVQGEGTTSEIRLPLTLAIMAALLVQADGRAFAIPLDRIERTVRLADQTVRSVAGRRMLVMPDGVMPLVCASEQYGGSRTENAAFGVLIRGNGQRIAFAVSAMDGQRELVTRPLPPEVADGSALSGAAVLSDGQIALIVDCDAVAEGVA
ncbi:chemotaxis protein CheA [Solirubrobacter sp. CPCC 204708]|uniref:Chemotaxis protein CheA n=1 Tax=Solirubrobacter deserti TaxID=2282478 RepID=A0ABT4REH4_9ACTN|nr:chemotaxis protein CheA [Solirubrobacter deserti]MBE2316009.1 chemotaxis protein CheA [Solirubrobacter deserti]MDA0136761.1 chemotaxis protein CheA [Solirubrobacter deserti]